MFDGRYTLWGGEHSLFTRKLRAMLNYLTLDYEFKLKSAESGPAMEARLGTHFIPGLETPEGWFIHDTTPIGLMNGLVVTPSAAAGVTHIMWNMSPKASMPTTSVSSWIKD